MSFGLTPQGFNLKRLADLKQDIENDLIAEFGEINTQPQSVFGQIVGIFAKMFADNWENLQEVYYSQYPNTAQGVSLDNVVQFNGLTRRPESQTSVIASCTGLEGTAIPLNSQARISNTGQVFIASPGGIITRQVADKVTVSVDNVTNQSYTVVASNEAFTYSLPNLVFSNVGDIFVASNVIIVTINGIALAPVNFITDSDTTLAAVATAISGFSGVASAIASNPDTIIITANAGASIAINTPVDITGGITQASSSVVFRTPADANEISAGLVALLNVGTPSWTATDLMGSLTIQTNSEEVAFSCNVGIGLSVTAQSSPIIFLSENFGPIPCPTNALDTIITPLSGWDSIINREDGVIGRNLETDAELRIRRLDSIKLLGNCTVEAIRAKLLTIADSASVFENITLYQVDIVIVFPLVFDPGDTVTVVYDDTGNFTVPYNTSQAQTMDDICAQFELITAVASCVHGGTGDRTLTISMNPIQTLFVNSVTTDVSAQTATISGGRPPKSFEAIVEGGTDADIANQIWQSKPAGIETYGNTSFTITDSQGNPQVIFFSRPTEIYISVQVALTLYSEENFPVNGIPLVRQTIFDYGSGLGVGADVLLQRVLAQIFNVPGIASGNMQIAATTNINDIPSYGTSDISISDSQISIWNLERIFVTVV